MKTLLLLFALAISAFAENANVTLSWPANPEPDVSEYRLYVGTAKGVYGAPVTVEGTSKTLALLKDTIHYAVVAAVNTSGIEGAKSPELAFQVFKPGEGKAPSAPVGIKKSTALQAVIERSEDLKAWAVVHTQSMDETATAVFYRLSLVLR